MLESGFVYSYTWKDPPPATYLIWSETTAASHFETLITLWNVVSLILNLGYVELESKYNFVIPVRSEYFVLNASSKSAFECNVIVGFRKK